MNYSLSLVLFLYTLVTATAQQRIQYDATQRRFTLDNPLVQRVLQLGPTGVQTVAYTDLRTKDNFVYRPDRVKELAFTVNGIPFTGRGAAGFMVAYKAHSITEKAGQGSTLRLDLQVQYPNRFLAFDLSLFYQIFPDLPLTRKWVMIKNTGNEPLRINDLEWENLNLEVAAPFWIPGLCTVTDVYVNYGQTPVKPPYIGRADDAAILLHDPEQNAGVLLGNEAPAILKRTHVYRDSTEIGIGMGFENDDFPFQKTLLTDEIFTSPKAFVGLFKGETWQDAYEHDLAGYVRKYLGTKLFAHKKLPTSFYNTRIPFNQTINEARLKKLADDLAPTGIDYLIIDDGWQDRYGDWNHHPQKFPNGLRVVTDYIRSKGLTPGFWISLATASDSSALAQEHPDWFMTDREGRVANIHGNYMKTDHTMSLDTPWFDFMLQKIRSLVDDNGFGYVKLDLASAYSAYRLNNYEAGDWATGAARTYGNQKESLWRLYERTTQLMDSLKASHPNLLIDCTYELYGRTYGTDLWLIQHADYDWLSNIRLPVPAGNRFMRQLNHDRGRIVPTSTLLIGNLRLDDPQFRQNYLSMAASTIMLLGDATKLSPADKAWLKTWNAWLAGLNERTHYTRFFQTGDVLPRPDLRNWDGCIRFNPERNGGLLCFYRNDSPEATRTFVIKGVKPANTYQLRQGGSNTPMGTFTGQQLLSTGLPVTIPNRHEAALFSIEPYTKPETAVTPPVAPAPGASTPGAKPEPTKTVPKETGRL